MVSLGNALYTSTKVHFWRYFMKYFLFISVLTLLFSSCSNITDSYEQENDIQATTEEADTNTSECRTLMIQSPIHTEKQPKKDSDSHIKSDKPSNRKQQGNRNRE